MLRRQRDALPERRPLRDDLDADSDDRSPGRKKENNLVKNLNETQRLGDAIELFPEVKLPK